MILYCFGKLGSGGSASTTNISVNEKKTHNSVDEDWCTVELDWFFMHEIGLIVSIFVCYNWVNVEEGLEG